MSAESRRFDRGDEYGERHGSSHHRRSEAIRADIERTRAELDRTVDALQQRLSPQQLVHGAFEALRENAGDSTRRIVNVVKSNPIPIALIGAGLVWLLASQARRRGADDEVECYEYDEYEGYEFPATTVE